MSINVNMQNTIQANIDGKIKPVGSLGKIEQLALQIANLQVCDDNLQLSIEQPHLLIFAGDHGIAKHNVSIAPSDVTSMMVQCFLNGQAAINSFIKNTAWQMRVVDCGTLHEPNAHQQLIHARLGTSCGDISIEAALTDSQLDNAKSNAEQIIADLNANLVAFGEMGIGNTSSASAIFAALFDFSIDAIVGLGTGIDEQQLTNKKALINKALLRVNSNTPNTIIKELSSFEIATMVFAMLSAYKHNKLILVDGFIVTAAAALAMAIEPKIKENMIFSHVSAESAHGQVLAQMKVTPLLDLSLRLGEGTGAVLCLPLITAAVNFYNDMASFEDLGISL